MEQPDLSPDAPWKRRFRAWSIASAAVASRAASRGIATTNRSGVQQVYAWDVPSGDLRQLTFAPAGKIMASLSPDGRFIYYLNDEQGNEIGHVVRVPFEGGEAEDVTPDMPPYALGGLAMSRDGRHLAFTEATREGFHTHLIELGAGGEIGDRRLLYHTRPLMRGVQLSNDGALAMLALTERSQSTDMDLAAIDTVTGERVGELYDDGASVAPARFSRVAGDERVLCSTTRSGVSRPVIWNPRSGARLDLDFEDVPGDVLPVDWSENGGKLLLMQVHEAVQRLAVYALDEANLTWLDHLPGTMMGVHFAPDGEIYALRSDSTRPARVVALDEQTGAERRVLLQGDDAPAGVPWRSISFPSTEGAHIQAWLAQPPGDGPFPTILDTHGGPSAVAMEYFHPRAQSWVDHGFAFLSINYRGSVTFGREFENCIRGDLGHWETDDMAAAQAWLTETGVAMHHQIFLFGASYGGYLTLLGLGKLADLWAGGIAQVAIADWVLMYEDQAETLRRFQVALFGGTPEELPEQHARSSPITYADRVRAPLLVIQGSNDTRCPARQMHAYEKKMRELGKEIEVVWFDAGHGSFAIEQNIEHQEHMLQFAYRVLRSAKEGALGA
ncbi:MAG: prolyl oligopeptidase family serine peptidase [Dehalococcoidia bacterium]